ncbi:MAG: NAD-dependent epimerase/dehydratase family protein [Alphaproteobacteria bacterium]|nr:NAD-dependent epimerase/dehydratase family protein [Alphaproteobacteria bacterium]
MPNGVSLKSVLVVGGAGFIGSHFVDHLLARNEVRRVTVYDNLSSGQLWHLGDHLQDQRVRMVRGDVKDLPALTATTEGHATIIHLASNPDIARAQTDPTIDFYEGTLLTQNVLEAMRQTGAHTILYASGSGVYGDLGTIEAREEDSTGLPVSTYGASKLAGETLISAYCHMFGLRGRAFRFGNVVGRRQTHGVGYDFLRRLLADPTRLRILGDGRQSKSYIHVDDVIGAVMAACRDGAAPFRAYNVATGDYITVTEIAELALKILELPAGSARFEYTGGDRGWKGDVPIVRIATERIRAIGWRCARTSRQAMEAAMRAMLDDLRSGRGA